MLLVNIDLKMRLVLSGETGTMRDHAPLIPHQEYRSTNVACATITRFI